MRTHVLPLSRAGGRVCLLQAPLGQSSHRSVRQAMMGKSPWGVSLLFLFSIVPLASCIVLVFSTARADDIDTVRTFTGVVDTVEVFADRPEPLETLPTFAVAHEIELSGGVATVADIIESGVGTHVRRYGGLGSYSAASIRASTPGQVEVYVDGVPLMSGQWGVTNLADVPLDGVERVEVYRGGAPASFGTPGIGGVINLITRPAGEGRSFAAVTGGSHGTWKVDLLESGSARSVGYMAAFHHLRSEGDFEYLDRHGTPENPDDDEIVSPPEQRLPTVRPDAPPVAARLARLARRTRRRHLQEGERCPGDRERPHQERALRDLPEHRPSLRHLAAPRRRSRTQGDRLPPAPTRPFFNPDDEVGFNRSDTDNLGRAYGANALATAHWHAARQVVRLFAETRRERFITDGHEPGRRNGIHEAPEHDVALGGGQALRRRFRRADGGLPVPGIGRQLHRAGAVRATAAATRRPALVHVPRSLVGRALEGHVVRDRAGERHALRALSVHAGALRRGRHGGGQSGADGRGGHDRGHRGDAGVASDARVRRLCRWRNGRRRRARGSTTDRAPRVRVLPRGARGPHRVPAELAADRQGVQSRVGRGRGARGLRLRIGRSTPRPARAVERHRCLHLAGGQEHGAVAHIQRQETALRARAQPVSENGVRAGTGSALARVPVRGGVVPRPRQPA